MPKGLCQPRSAVLMRLKDLCERAAKKRRPLGCWIPGRQQVSHRGDCARWRGRPPAVPLPDLLIDEYQARRARCALRSRQGIQRPPARVFPAAKAVPGAPFTRSESVSTPCDPSRSRQRSLAPGLGRPRSSVQTPQGAMVKFGEYLEKQAKEEWRPAYLDYKGLKDLIKESAQEADTAGPTTFSPRTTSLSIARAGRKADASEERFFQKLEAEVRRRRRRGGGGGRRARAGGAASSPQGPPPAAPFRISLTPHSRNPPSPLQKPSPPRLRRSASSPARWWTSCASAWPTSSQRRTARCRWRARRRRRCGGGFLERPRRGR